jgi:VRR-NUC domain
MKRRATDPTEAQLEAAVRDILAYDGWIVRHLEQNWSDRKRKTVGERGMPDLLAIRYGYMDPQPLDSASAAAVAEVLYIELKTPRGRVSPEQRAWHLYERKLGALVWVAGETFPATVDGFRSFYAASGLQRRGAVE